MPLGSKCFLNFCYNLIVDALFNHNEFIFNVAILISLESTRSTVAVEWKAFSLYLLCGLYQFFLLRILNVNVDL